MDYPVCAQPPARHGATNVSNVSLLARRSGRGSSGLGEGGDRVTESPTTEASDAHIWKPAKTFDDFGLVCCGRPHMHLLNDPELFSLSHRVGRVGAATVSEVAVGHEMSVD